jgi:hypothetical protein
MTKPPDYNPTVPLENTSEIPFGALLKAIVGREHVKAVSGTPSASDEAPRSGRVAVDTSTDPETYYVGDGSSWQTVESWAELQARNGGVGSVHNPDTVDLDGSDTDYTASGEPRDSYTLKVSNGGGTSAELQGVQGIVKAGVELKIVADTVSSNITIADANGDSPDFLCEGDSDKTLDASGETIVFVCDGTDWRQAELDQQ